MKYFAVLLPMKDADKSQKFRPQHLAFLENMRNSGQVAVNGKFADGSGGLVIYKAESFQDCEALVKTDPYVAEGAREYEIFEWEAVWADNVT
ncbi:YciI family protein [Planococcus sp. SE5232]|uniref:YciI family protein n=1 Tax=unclassified Planococcus (in: firmicutes) TaxID=2662419 RepID=UPI001CC0B9A0|nr:YciI family protein [Planococcus sp. 4-30]